MPKFIISVELNNIQLIFVMDNNFEFRKTHNFRDNR